MKKVLLSSIALLGVFGATVAASATPIAQTLPANIEPTMVFPGPAQNLPLILSSNATVNQTIVNSKGEVVLTVTDATATTVNPDFPVSNTNDWIPVSATVDGTGHVTIVGPNGSNGTSAGFPGSGSTTPAYPGSDAGVDMPNFDNLTPASATVDGNGNVTIVGPNGNASSPINDGMEPHIQNFQSQQIFPGLMGFAR